MWLPVWQVLSLLSGDLRFGRDELICTSLSQRSYQGKYTRNSTRRRRSHPTCRPLRSITCDLGCCRRPRYSEDFACTDDPPRSRRLSLYLASQNARISTKAQVQTTWTRYSRRPGAGIVYDFIWSSCHLAFRHSRRPNIVRDMVLVAKRKLKELLALPLYCHEVEKER